MEAVMRAAEILFSWLLTGVRRERGCGKLKD